MSETPDYALTDDQIEACRAEAVALIERWEEPMDTRPQSAFAQIIGEREAAVQAQRVLALIAEVRVGRSRKCSNCALWGPVNESKLGGDHVAFVLLRQIGKGWCDGIVQAHTGPDWFCPDFERKGE